MHQKASHTPFIITILAFLSIGYLILAGSTVGLTTVQYDEFTDLVIAASLSTDPFIGSAYDGSQARLPMYVTALAFHILPIDDPLLDPLAGLWVSRWISLVVTVLALWGTFLLGYRLFDLPTGLLASALFAASPYVLHFGRDALTQGDAFTATTVVFTLVAFERFHHKRTTSWVLCCALCLALTITAKFFLVILIPALITYSLVVDVSKRYSKASAPPTLAQSDEKLTIAWGYVVLASAIGLLALLTLLVSLLRFTQAPAIQALMYRSAQGVWLLTLLGSLLMFLSAFHSFRGGRAYLVDSDMRWRTRGAWFVILPLTFALSLALCPTHIFNPYVLPVLLERLFTFDGNSDFWATAIASGKLYLGLLLFKLGLPFGIATYIALGWAVRNASTDKGLLLLMIVLFYNGLLLVALPLQQPFWLMSVYPLIMLVLANLLVRLFKQLPNATLRLGWAGLVVFAFAWLLLGVIRVYPTFGYYGYEWVGNHWLGSEARGYRALVVVTNDGSTEAIDWLRQHVPAEAVVLSYLNDIHLINYLESREPLHFNLIHALQLADPYAMTAAWSRANFVVVRLVNDLEAPSPLGAPAFIRQFGTEPVYQIFRGRGIYRMPLIQIYQRTTSSGVMDLQMIGW